MPFVSIQGKAIHFLEGRGREGADLLIFLHGAGTSANVWLRQLRCFEGHCRVLAVDLPGHGSSAGEGEEQIEGYVGHLDAFLAAMGVEESFLVGHSMGGAIALHFALLHPRRVKKMALAGTGARLRVPRDLFAALQGDFREAVRTMCRYAYSPQFPTFLLSLGEAEAGRERPEVLLRDFAACEAFDFERHLPEIEQETLILCGGEDRFTPLPLSIRLSQRLRRAQLEVIEGAGHMVMIEDASSFNAALGRFLGTPVFS